MKYIKLLLLCTILMLLTYTFAKYFYNTIDIWAYLPIFWAGMIYQYFMNKWL